MYKIELKINKIIIILVLLIIIFFGLSKSTFASSGDNKEKLNEYFAKKIFEGRITLEDGRVDSLLYNTTVLNPEADDDRDGIKNKDELFIYTKNGMKYLGYNSNPKLLDTDGDGISDRDDSDPLMWDISSRDMAMFMELSYRVDGYVTRVLDEKNKLTNIYGNRPEYSMIHKELAHFWKIKESYHESNGFDAILFENSSKFPYLKNNSIQVLGIRGTNDVKDVDDDLLIFGGNNPKQAYSVINLMDRYSKSKKINNLYITGHSLGGYLAHRANIHSSAKNYNFVNKIYSFNAPKIKWSLFWPSLNKAAKIGDNLTRNGKSIHYIVNNDQTIYLVGTFKHSVNIGNTKRRHSSRSYFEPILNTQPGFSVGKRNNISGYGYADEIINKIKFYKIQPIPQKDNEYFNPYFEKDYVIIKDEDEKVTDEEILSKIIDIPNSQNLKEAPVIKIQKNKGKEAVANVIFRYKDDTETSISIPIKYNTTKKETVLSKSKNEDIKKEKDKREINKKEVLDKY